MKPNFIPRNTPGLITKTSRVSGSQSDWPGRRVQTPARRQAAVRAPGPQFPSSSALCNMSHAKAHATPVSALIVEAITSLKKVCCVCVWLYIMYLPSHVYFT